MKKFYCIVIALVMSVFMASAQTVEHAGLFENTYVTLMGGATTTGQFNAVPSPFFWDGAKGVANGLRPFAGLELGKYVTPVVGFSVEGLAFYNTTTSQTFIDESAVLANGKLNFSNWFGGYKGQPRRVEVVGVIGMGWGHDYVNGAAQTWTSYLTEGLEPVVGNDPYNTNGIIFTDKDYVVYNAGAELNVNLGKARAWQINVRPGVMWFNKHTKTQYQSLPRFMSDARANVQLGVTYKFGSKKKGGAHNFVLCPYSVTQADYDAVVAERDAFANRKPETKEVVREVIRTERVTEYRETPAFGKTYITFAIGSAALSNVERAKLAEFAKNIKDDNIVYIVGSADSKTGTETRNFALAQRRAEVVRNVLIGDFGVKNDIKISTALDVVNDAELARAAVLTLEAIDVE